MDIEFTLNEIDSLISKLDCEASQIFTRSRQQEDEEIAPLQAKIIENEIKDPNFFVSQGSLFNFQHNDAGEVLELHEFALLGIERTLKEDKISNISFISHNNTDKKKIRHINKSPFKVFIYFSFFFTINRSFKLNLIKCLKSSLPHLFLPTRYSPKKKKIIQNYYAPITKLFSKLKRIKINFYIMKNSQLSTICLIKIKIL